MTKRAERRSSVTEIVTSVVGSIFTVLLFTFAVFQTMQTAGGPAAVASIVSSEPVEDGRTRLVVEVANTGGIGLFVVHVRVGCGDSELVLEFQNMPVGDRQGAECFCDAQGAVEATAEVVAFRPT